MSISKRFALKEAQNKMIQKLIKDAKLDEEQANALIYSHLANMAAIDKATDEEKARRVVELEMKLTERKALARQKVSWSYCYICGSKPGQERDPDKSFSKTTLPGSSVESPIKVSELSDLLFSLFRDLYRLFHFSKKKRSGKEAIWKNWRKVILTH